MKPAPPVPSWPPSDLLAGPPQSGAAGHRGVLLAVTGASGGLGASVLTAALAVRAAAAGRTACAVDLDVLGGGLDVVMGLEQTSGTRWADLVALDGDADGGAILPTLPSSDGVPVLSHDRGAVTAPPTVVGAVVTALTTVCDLVVLDLPSPALLGAGCPPLDLHLLLTGTTASQVAALSSTLAGLAGLGLVGLGGTGTPGGDAGWPGPGDPRDPGGPGDGGAVAGHGGPQGRGAPDGRPGAGVGGRVPVRPVTVPGVLVRPGPGGGAVSRAAAVAEVVAQQLGAWVVGVLADDRSVEADLAHGLAPAGRRGPLASTAELVLASLLPSRDRGAA